MKFAFFLHKNGLLSTAELIDVILEQYRSSRPLLYFLQEMGLEKEILRALEIQVETAQSLLQIQESKLVFPLDKFRKAQEEQSLSRKSVSEIVLSKDYLTLEKLEEQIVAFYGESQKSDVSKENLNQDANIESPSDSDEATEEPPINEAALESLKELVEMGNFDEAEYLKLKSEFEKKKSENLDLKTVSSEEAKNTKVSNETKKDPVLLNNYSRYFNKKNIAEILGLLRQNNLVNKKEMIKRIKELKGVCQLVKAEHSFRMAEQILADIENDREEKSILSLKTLYAFAQLFIKTGSEDEVLKNKTLAKQVEEIFKS